MLQCSMYIMFFKWDYIVLAARMLLITMEQNYHLLWPLTRFLDVPHEANTSMEYINSLKQDM